MKNFDVMLKDVLDETCCSDHKQTYEVAEKVWKDDDKDLGSFLDLGYLFPTLDLGLKRPESIKYYIWAMNELGIYGEADLESDDSEMKFYEPSTNKTKRNNCVDFKQLTIFDLWDINHVTGEVTKITT